MDFDVMSFKKIVRDVARSVASKYPSYVESQDTEQELYLWLYEKRKSITSTMEKNPTGWQPMIASTMHKVARDYCEREKAAREGYHVEDLFRYTEAKIRNLLPDALNHEDWQTFGQHGDGQPSMKGQANETGDRLAMLVDIRSAVERLPEDTKNFLFLQHVHHYTMDNLAETFGLSLSGAKMRASRAIGSIQKELGRKQVDSEEEARRPAKRMVRSNGAWRAAQSSQYDS